MKCNNCGQELRDDAKFCTNCGAPVQEAQTPAEAEPVASAPNAVEEPVAAAQEAMPTELQPVEQTLPKEVPQPAQEQPQADSARPGLVGWSEKINAPEITQKANRKYKLSQLWARLFAAAIVIVCCLLGYFVPQLPLTYALLAGLIGAAVVLFLNAQKNSAYTQPAWEGEVIDKKVIQKQQKPSGGNEGEVYYLYKTFFRTTFGKKKSYVSEDVYTYLRIGDRVRFHPSLQYFEKYDKSRDLNIYCCVCKAANPIENDVCLKCKAPLIKP